MNRVVFAVLLVTVAACAADPPAAIHREFDLAASPQRVYEALLDAKRFAALSGAPAEIDRRVGGAFSLFGGQIRGRNIELAPNRRVVQAWRPASWPEGVYSIVKFELIGQGSSTHVILDHTGFPPEKREQLASGWQAHYWGPLTKYFGSASPSR
jgi:activator of HSP90 ATPase